MRVVRSKCQLQSGPEPSLACAVKSALTYGFMVALLTRANPKKEISKYGYRSLVLPRSG